MGIITGYSDDASTTDSDKFLTSDSGGATKLTPASTLKTYILADGNITTAKILDANVTTAKIATNAVTADKLATSAITLGYAQITANFSTAATSATIVTGLTASVTIPAGGRKVRITAYTRDVFNGSTGYQFLSVWDGTVGSGTLLSLAQAYVTAGTASGSYIAIAVHTPSAGAKTYNIGLHTTAGTALIDAGATYPAFILVEAI